MVISLINGIKIEIVKTFKDLNLSNKKKQMFINVGFKEIKIIVNNEKRLGSWHHISAIVEGKSCLDLTACNG